MFSFSFRKCSIYCTYLSHTDYFYGALVFFWSLKGLCNCKIEISALFKMCLFVHVPQRKWNPTDLEQYEGEDIKIVNNHFRVNWSFNRNTVRKTNCSLLTVVIFTFHFIHSLTFLSLTSRWLLMWAVSHQSALPSSFTVYPSLGVCGFASYSQWDVLQLHLKMLL